MNNLPKILWLTDPVDISSEDRRELQNILAEWCKKQTGTRTVYPNYKRYVRVRKGWFEINGNY